MEQEPQRKYAVQSRTKNEIGRVDYMLRHADQNKAAKAVGDVGTLYKEYRRRWRETPATAIRNKIYGEKFKALQKGPLCVDIETAAICNLACPFCYRQFIATPDKLMDINLYMKLIDQCAEIDVPSIKLNWRGEPLMHPKLPEMVKYAKDKGILEVIINTNAVLLTEKLSKKLIDAGLDLMIYSFDGGTKESYEKMRIGRYGENTFEPVVKNIRDFARIRNEMGSPFPRTKIQMILVEENHNEIESFFNLFEDCVDDVSLKAYTERGGDISDLDKESRLKVLEYLADQNLPDDTPYWKDKNSDILVSQGRLACEQPYQRLMVTFHGSVSMCCYDWGNEHPVGFLDDRAIKNSLKEYEKAKEKSEAGDFGYDHIKNLSLPKRYIKPNEVVQTLKEIWHGKAINTVRKCHVNGAVNAVDICKQCQFKETYAWKKI